MSSPLHTFRSQHMATYFEIKIAHAEAAYAGQAAQAAFQVCVQLEAQLSRYIDTSEISQIASLSPGESLRVSPDTLECLQIAAQIQHITGGAFDPTLGPEIDAARAQESAPGTVPKGRLVLDSASSTLQVVEGAVRLDLGAIGKGFALDQMASVLADWDIENALLIAGGSSIRALGKPQSEGFGWEIHLGPGESVFLLNRSIGSSGTAVKGAHILDPRTGRPSSTTPYRTWAMAPTAALADALSTAWMLLNAEQIRAVLKTDSTWTAHIQRLENGPIHDLSHPLFTPATSRPFPLEKAGSLGLSPVNECFSPSPGE